MSSTSKYSPSAFFLPSVASTTFYQEIVRIQIRRNLQSLTKINEKVRYASVQPFLIFLPSVASTTFYQEIVRIRIRRNLQSLTKVNEKGQYIKVQPIRIFFAERCIYYLLSRNCAHTDKAQSSVANKNKRESAVRISTALPHFYVVVSLRLLLHKDLEQQW